MKSRRSPKSHRAEVGSSSVIAGCTSITRGGSMSGTERNPRRSEAAVEFVGWLVGETRETIDEESLLLQALEGFVVLLEKT